VNSQAEAYRAKAKEYAHLTVVCTENLIRIDCVTESPKRQRR
jgi:hypothetical protein